LVAQWFLSSHLVHERHDVICGYSRDVADLVAKQELQEAIGDSPCMEYGSLTESALAAQVLLIVPFEASPCAVVQGQLHNALFDQEANEVPDHEARVRRPQRMFDCREQLQRTILD